MSLYALYCTLRYAQHVSGTSVPIIRSSRLYVCICRLWWAVFGCCLSGVRCRAAGCASWKRDAASIPLPGLTRQIHTYSLELLMMGIKVSETCWAYHKVHTVTSSWVFFSTQHRTTFTWCLFSIPNTENLMWILWLAEELLAFQEGHCSIGLFGFVMIYS